LTFNREKTIYEERKRREPIRPCRGGGFPLSWEGETPAYLTLEKKKKYTHN